MIVSSVPRHYVFVLVNGVAVVRLTGNQVRDLRSGQVYPYKQEQYGRAMTDGELRQLQADGCIRGYTAERVELPASIRVVANTSSRVQAYYVATTLPVSQFDNVRAVLPQLPLTSIVQAIQYDDVVAICQPKGEPFQSLHEAEDVRQQLAQAAPDLFGQAFVSVYEVALHRWESPEDAAPLTKEVTQLPPVAAGTTTGHSVVIVGTDPEGELPVVLKQQLDMRVYEYDQGASALPVIEDINPAIIIVNVQLSDIHGWAFIQKLREIPSVSGTPLIVISDDADDMIVSLKVIRARAFFVRPVDLTRLLRKIQEIIEGNDTR